MTILNSQVLDDLNVHVELEFDEGMAAAPPRSDKFAKTVTVSQEHIKINGFLDFPAAREWKDEKLIKSISEYNTSVDTKEWEDTFAIKRKDIETDQLHRYDGMAAAMGNAGARLKDQRVAAALQAGTSTLGFDGLPIFSTAHTLNPAGTQSNYSASGMPLNSGSIGAVYEAMLGYTNSEGASLGMEPFAIVVPPQLALDAAEALKTLVSGGEDNVVSKLPLEVIVFPELVNQGTTWYMLARKGTLQPVKYFERKAPHFVKQDDAQSENVFMRAEYHYGFEASGEAALGHWFYIYKAVA